MNLVIEAVVPWAELVCGDQPCAFKLARPYPAHGSQTAQCRRDRRGDQRFVETIFDDGEIVRTLVDPTKKPARRPRKPLARTRVIDDTRKKRI
jgi:hypothetical protein